MANYTITAASVLASTSASKTRGVAGETITQGMPVYRDSGTGLLLKASADDLNAAQVVGIALSASSLNQPLFYCIADPAFTHGLSGSVPATVVVLSDNLGGALCPQADLGVAGVPNALMMIYGDTSSQAALSCGPLYTPELIT